MSNVWFEQAKATALRHVQTEVSIVERALTNEKFPPSDSRKKFLESQKARLAYIEQFIANCQG